MELISRILERLNIRPDVHMREILGGTVAALLVRGGGVLAVYVFTLVVSRLFGPSGLGLYSLAVTILTLVGLGAGFGFGLSALRFVPQCLAENRSGEFRGIYRTMLELAIPVSVVLSVALFVAAPWVAARLFKNPALALALRIMSAILPFFVVGRINVETIRGFKNIAFSEYLRSLHGPVVAAAVLFGAICFVRSPQAAIAAYAVGVVTACALSLWGVERRLRLCVPPADSRLSRAELIRISSPMMLGEFMRAYLGRIDTLVLGLLTTTGAVGVYDVAFKLSSVTGLFLAAVSMIIAPKFSELFWSGQIEDLERIVGVAARLMFWSSFPVLILLAIVPHFWLGLFGKEFQGGAVALIILAIGQFVNTAAGSVGVFLNMTGKQNVFRNITLAAVVVNVAMNCILIPPFGVTGAAIATTLTLVAWNVTASAYIWGEFRIRTFYVPLLPR
jgi:O-antigen/teichoic acid export membrane protein